MKNSFHKGFASVYTDEKGQHKIILPNSEDITHLVSTITTDNIGEDAICEAKFLVNIVRTKEEALNNYSTNPPTNE